MMFEGEARRLLDRDHLPHTVEALYAVECELRKQAFLRDSENLRRQKLQILSAVLPTRMIFHPDEGLFTSEIVYPAETQAALDVLDQAIREVAKAYGWHG